MTNVEVIEKPEIIKELDRIEEVGKLKLKGYTFRDIAEITELTVAQVKKHANEYFQLIQYQADADPYFLEKIQFNTLKLLSELDDISKEAWETVNIATDNGMITARIQALKLAAEIAGKKAQLQQLGTGHKSDGDLMARTQKAETVNSILSDVIREVVSECDRCNDLARMKLAEAFDLMDREYEEAETVDDDN